MERKTTRRQNKATGHRTKNRTQQIRNIYYLTPSATRKNTLPHRHPQHLQKTQHEQTYLAPKTRKKADNQTESRTARTYRLPLPG